MMLCLKQVCVCCVTSNLYDIGILYVSCIRNTTEEAKDESNSEIHQSIGHLLFDAIFQAGGERHISPELGAMCE